jgi:KUP system potassium uptake protein
MGKKLSEDSLPLPLFIADVIQSKPLRVPGTAAFLTGSMNIAPRTLLHNFKHNRILHQNIILLTIVNQDLPRIPDSERVSVEKLEAGFTRISAQYGFMETPDLSLLLSSLKVDDLDLTPARVTFFLGRETIILIRQKNMFFWRKILFAFLSKNARDASRYFNIPPNRVIEIGIQVEL